MTRYLIHSVSLVLSVAIAAPGFGQSMTASDHPWKAGNERATMPWSAPAGHHQPSATDIVDSNSVTILDQEDVKIDRLVKGVCRGC